MSKRRGKKRKYEVELENLLKLQEQPSQASKNDHSSSASITEGLKDCHSVGESQGAAGQTMDDSIKEGSIQETSTTGIVKNMLVGQLLNLVPPCFKDRLKYMTNILNQVEGLEDVNHEEVGILASQIGSIKYLGTPDTELLWNATFATKKSHVLFLGPPTTDCFKCSRSLKFHNLPSQILCFGLTGPVPALKITLRCTACLINYRYCTYI